MPTDVLSRSPCLRVSVLSVARQAQVPIIMSQGYLPNKIQCFCGKFRHLRSRSVLWPALASQGPSSRTGQTRQIALTGSQNLLEACKILPEYSFHESVHSSAQNAKPRMTPKGLVRAEVQQRVEEFATLISCHNSLPLQTQRNMRSRSTS